MITSRDNGKVKWMRSLLDGKGRRREGCFMAEGLLLLEEALDAGARPRLVLYDPAAMQATLRGRRLLERIGPLSCEEVSEPVLRSVSDTVTSQGAAAALPLPPAPAALPPTGLVVILDGLRDPGNIGAVLRSAGAAACAAVVTTPDTADPYAPKAVRAGMGAHFWLQLMTDVPWSQLSSLLGNRLIYLAEANQGEPYYEVDWTRPAALVIGHETEGVRPEAQQCATGRVSIPMPGRAESLNAGVAASIIIFESVRQHLAVHKGA